jgi:Ni/Co efflux regulator RcnB
VTGQPPGQGRDRGNWQGRGAQAVAPQQQAVAPPQDQNRGNWQGRGNGQGRGAQQQAAAPQQTPQDQNRWQGQGGGRQGYQGYANRDNSQGYASGRGNWQRGYDNRGGYQGGGYDNRNTYQGERYASRGGRNYSGFRDYHRDWRATNRFRIGGYHRPSGFYAHRWTFGEFLPRPYWMQDYWLADYADYDLPPPPYGTVWVRVDQDALLIDRDSGEIISVVYGVFY